MCVRLDSVFSFHWSVGEPNKFMKTSFTFKGCVRYIFASLFFKSEKGALMKLGKVYFTSLKKLFLSSRKSKFRVLDIRNHDVI